MTIKRRGGQKSGSYPNMGATPGGGIPAANVTDVLASMAAQLDAFSQEVRELKGLIRELRGTTAAKRSVGWETTESLDVESFRRARRQRMVLLTAAVMVPLMLLAVWGMWPTPAPRAVLPAAPAALVAKQKIPSPAPIPAPQPALALAVATPVPVPQAVIAPPAPDPVAVPKHRVPVASAPVQSEVTAPAERARPARAVTASTEPEHSGGQEHSGGAPILD
jgi:hypothetical protein